MPGKPAAADGGSSPSKRSGQGKRRAARRVADAAGGSPAALPDRPASVLEIRVFPGAIEVSEYYSEGQSEALARALAAYGVRTDRRFASRCG